MREIITEYGIVFAGNEDYTPEVSERNFFNDCNSFMADNEVYFKNHLCDMFMDFSALNKAVTKPINSSTNKAA